MDNKENYIYTETYQKPDWDKSGDSEVSLKYANCNNLCMLASSIAKLAGNLNTPPECLEDFFDKLKILEEEWHTTETKYHSLLVEHEKTQSLLDNERSKTAVLNKRMKFIQDNQKNFETLRQAYLNMKQNEIPNVSTEKEIQTKNEISATEQSLNVKRAQETLQKLKEMINEREKSWSYNREREEELRNEIKDLKGENQILQSLLDAKDLEIKTMDVYEYELKDKRKKENEVLKRIIIKLQHKIRDYESNNGKGKPLIFTDKEKLMIQRLMEVRPLQESLKRSNTSLSSELLSRRSSAVLKIDSISKRNSGLIPTENLKKKSSGNVRQLKSKSESSPNEIEYLTGKLRQICHSRSTFTKKQISKENI